MIECPTVFVIETISRRILCKSYRITSRKMNLKSARALHSKHVFVHKLHCLLVSRDFSNFRYEVGRVEFICSSITICRFLKRNFNQLFDYVPLQIFLENFLYYQHITVTKNLSFFIFYYKTYNNKKAIESSKIIYRKNQFLYICTESSVLFNKDEISLAIDSLFKLKTTIRQIHNFTLNIIALLIVRVYLQILLDRNVHCIRA